MTMTWEFGTKFLQVRKRTSIVVVFLSRARGTAKIVPTVSFSMKFGVSPRPKRMKGSWRGADEDLGVAMAIWVWPDLPVVE